jgi:hypothetical protein
MGRRCDTVHLQFGSVYTRDEASGFSVTQVQKYDVRVGEQRGQCRCLSVVRQCVGRIDSSVLPMGLRDDRKCAQPVRKPNAAMLLTFGGVNEDWSGLGKRALAVERAVGEQQTVFEADRERAQAHTAWPSATRQLAVNRVSIARRAPRRSRLVGDFWGDWANDKRRHGALR